ncbi:glycoside hydrolase family 3 N-terminal domain-containing protein [Synechococcus sp. PCC 6312]|uniref:glycoside hydrolase family 3 protein n=1 Tax=Synechococcus sp. (strain ATCC 27167 / PCC 6312) TaxID=195253 RepID=UPI00029F4260|nr:glycoside hydrolase family 3 N-terminal domain-containing protein [Synechococcus sp. PCC 6312]AFY62691.1 beta-glucosidase-like glycosyl hydrolase [Synechococcus sp. PCC 6312]
MVEVKMPLPELEQLSLPQLVAQMVVVRASGHIFDQEIQYPAWEPPTDILNHWVNDLGVGGVIFLGGSAAELSHRCQELQSQAPIPLLLAADIEEGVGQRFSGAVEFPPPLALAEIAQTQPERAQNYATKMGACIAREALGIGLNWVLAPVVDVNNNPANPVINVRAFGERPEIVSQLACAFIQGARIYPVLTAAKHFPGHGDTATDSHLDLPVLPHDRNRLETIEWPPFRAAIAAGVDTIMSAHLLIPSLDDIYPATLSYKALTEELRQAWGFQGLIVTDALVMGAIANRYGANQAPVMAVKAGADILLMPVDPPGAIDAVVAAVEAGEISRQRIEASVTRIFAAKARVFTEPSDFRLNSLSHPEDWQLSAEILRASQIASDLPCQLRANPNGINCLIVDDLLHQDYLSRTAPAVKLPVQFGFKQLELVDCNTSLGQLKQIPQQPTLVQIFSRGNPFRGLAGLSEQAQVKIQQLIASEHLVGIIIYGSPYVLDSIQPNLPKDIPYVFSYGHSLIAQNFAIETLFRHP